MLLVTWTRGRTRSDCEPGKCRYLKSLRQSQDVGNQSKLLLALVSSSAAALGIFEDDSLVLHKVSICSHK